MFVHLPSLDSEAKKFEVNSTTIKMSKYVSIDEVDESQN